MPEKTDGEKNPVQTVLHRIFLMKAYKTIK